MNEPRDFENEWRRIVSLPEKLKKATTSNKLQVASYKNKAQQNEADI